MLLLHIWMPIIFYGPVKYNLSRGTKMSRYFHCPIYHSLSLPYISLSFTAQYFISVFCTPLLIGPYFISPCILCQFSRQKIKSIYPISITIIIGSTLPWLTLHGTLGNFIAHDNGTSPKSVRTVVHQLWRGGGWVFCVGMTMSHTDVTAVNFVFTFLVFPRDPL